MAAWKKWVIALAFLLQIIVAGSVILVWYFQSNQWARAVIDWFGTPPGQTVALTAAGFLIVVAVVTIAVAVFRPTTSKQMTLFRSSGYKVKIDQAAVENSLRKSLAPYNLYNPDPQVKMHRNSQRADVTVNGMLSDRSDPTLLDSDIRRTIRQHLKSRFNIDLRKLKLNLQPFNAKKNIDLV